MDNESLQLLQISATAIAGLLFLLSFSFLTGSGDRNFPDKFIVTLGTALTVTPFALSAISLFTDRTDIPEIVNLEKRKRIAKRIMSIGFGMTFAVVVVIFGMELFITLTPGSSQEYKDNWREIFFNYPPGWKVSVFDDMINVTYPWDTNPSASLTIWSETLKNRSDVVDVLNRFLPGAQTFGYSNDTRETQQISYLYNGVRYHHIVAQNGSRFFVISYSDPKRENLLQKTELWPVETDSRVSRIINSMRIGMIELVPSKPTLLLSIVIPQDPIYPGRQQNLTIVSKDSLNESVKNVNITGWLFYPNDRRVQLQPALTDNYGSVTYPLKLTEQEIGKFRLKITGQATGYESQESSKIFMVRQRNYKNS